MLEEYSSILRKLDIFTVRDNLLKNTVRVIRSKEKSIPLKLHRIEV